ncbi:L-histidine N(alpha)-methyltransferase [Pseudenhygromyxa sp. WMMC2535]|uniref:L-histidine N(alpha)-methyltransferase n=1 Tax=Pseudenhygromyxa sp. WMMC2535 TaxID=2712867 RepID=UPI0015581A89|nr:L-histidine N(alpha)-methyltransferase [Pseudenhygromyxa sp. WMMC2535]NVB38630.1 L-histidine N(alpha)-methyltransferase [Pseudenhygromyxa sp. WMMC2535]
MSAITTLDPSKLESNEREQFALDVLMGLSTERRSLPSKYFYDAEGSRLFQKITSLAEYYPTRCEAEILRQHRDEMVELLSSRPTTIVELGAGDGTKTRILLEACAKRKLDIEYVPVDISRDALEWLVDALQDELPEIPTRGIVSEYFDALRWLNVENSERRKLVLMLGSNIGNFNPAQTRVFMRTLWNSCNPGDLVLTGFDLKKDIDVMLAAYNDREGVTRDFNLNLLRRINTELDGDFNLASFQHFGTYNVFSGAMESYLVSLRRQEVSIGALNKSFTFDPWEPIFVEYSFKFLTSDVEDLARETGFRPVGAWQDERGWFTDALWRVHKELV